jgi:hypothetical protein
VKLLFVTYCFGNASGQALIGVYKRGLRIALELCDRGHEVNFYCPGRENYHDEVTALAELRMRFVDIPFGHPALADAEVNRAVFLAEMARLELDVVVVGEAPLAGPLLESTLCAVELGIPVVVLDNAYQPVLVELFCRVHGPMVDGLILTGLSSSCVADPPAYLCQVPPLVRASGPEARALLRQALGTTGDPLLTVLAYDLNVESLGASLVDKLPPPLQAVFVTPDPDGCRQRLARLSDSVRQRAGILRPPPDPILFGLLEQSRLAVGKCAFMQVTECLSLGTPIIGFYFEGCFTLDYIPVGCQRFVHATANHDADEVTLAATHRLLRLAPGEMAAVHDGRLDATSKAADFLEALPREPRPGNTADCARLGFTDALVGAALDANHPGQLITLRTMRASRLRVMRDQDIYSLVCRYSVAGREHFARLWGRIFLDAGAAEAEADAVTASASGRRLLRVCPAERIVIEQDVGEALLPTIEEQ